METLIHDINQDFYTHTEVRAGSLETEICQVHNAKTMIGAIKSTNN